MRASSILAALPLTCLFATAAMAQAPAACTKQLSVVDEIQMASQGAGPSTVPVEINGAKFNLTFATAGTATQLSEQTVKGLGLAIAPGSEIALFDGEGRVSTNQVTIAKFTLGKLEGANVRIPVTPGGSREAGSGSAGLLSLNHMLPYDVDVDFGADKLRFFS